MGGEKRKSRDGERKVVLVTGGTGLVGKAVQEVVEKEAPADETWIFLSSKVGWQVGVRAHQLGGLEPIVYRGLEPPRGAP